MNELKNYNEKVFESIKNTNENGSGFWFARELMVVLEYKQWRRFEDVIKKAIINSNLAIDECFVNVGMTINMPNNATKTIADYKKKYHSWVFFYKIFIFG